MAPQLTLLHFLGASANGSGKQVPSKSVSEASAEERKEGNAAGSVSKLWEERIGSFKLCYEIEEPKDTGPCYLLGVVYDGGSGKAVCLLYDDREHKVYAWKDNTGHKPYFLTDLPPDKVRSIAKLVRHPSFDHVEVVDKFDLLLDRKVRMTKIVMKDPLAVRTVRNYVPKAWEAKIKYHDCYIYDQGLIPGMLYKIENGNLKPVEVKLSEEDIKAIEKAFEGEDEDTRKRVKEWIPLFQAPPPKVKRLAMDIEVYTPFKGRVPDPVKAEYPVISIAFAGSDGFKKILVLSSMQEWGKIPEEYPRDADIEIFDSERDMLIDAFRIISKYPLLLTFNGDNFDLNYLYHRALKLGIPRELIPFTWTSGYARIKHGFHVDLYKFYENRAVQAYAFDAKYKEFTLEAIASALLGVSKIKVEKNIGSLTLSELITYNFRDAELTLQLTTFNNELPWKLIVLLMRISKLCLEDVTRLRVSNWIRNLFYWEHRRRGLLIPLKEDIVTLKGEARTAATIKGKKYAGAIVIEPRPGAYFNVVVLDFASLYPSIIKKWNLSYETVNCPHEECKNAQDNKVPEVGHWVCKKRVGITAQITGLLRDFRVKIYKKKAKDKSLSEEERNWYDVVQRAMKVYINASYGVFGAESFPLYCPPAAESVTAIGRYTIKSTIQKASELGLHVLYGDTDSLFVHNPDQKKLEELRKWVEENFGLELDIDKVYRYVAFSGLKKNYIGVYPDGTVDIKGLMGKKRNTPEFLKTAFYNVVEALGKVQSQEDFERVKEYIREVVKECYMKLKNKEYMLDELAFRVMLSKPLSAYTKSTPQHVKAAKQLVAAGIHVEPGDIILYVKTKTRDGVKPVQLAKLSEIDVDKYVDHIESTFEQILAAFNIDMREVMGYSKLEAFFGF